MDRDWRGEALAQAQAECARLSCWIGRLEGNETWRKASEQHEAQSAAGRQAAFFASGDWWALEADKAGLGGFCARLAALGDLAGLAYLRSNLGDVSGAFSETGGDLQALGLALGYEPALFRELGLLGFCAAEPNFWVSCALAGQRRAAVWLLGQARGRGLKWEGLRLWECSAMPQALRQAARSAGAGAGRGSAEGLGSGDEPETELGQAFALYRRLALRFWDLAREGKEGRS